MTAFVVTDLFAGVRIRDVAAARSWYEQVLGSEPSVFPNDIEPVWDLGQDRWLYILEDPAGAGHALVTIMVDDLDAMVAENRARGVC